MSRTNRVQLILIAIPLVIVGVFISRHFRRPAIRDVTNAIKERRFLEAATLARQILGSGSTDPDLFLYAAMAHAELGEFEKATELCLRVPKQHKNQFVDARCMAGGLFLNQLGQLSKAEHAYRTAYATDSTSLNALMGLSRVLSIQTRTLELNRVHQEIIQRGTVSLPIILPLVQSDLLYPDESLIDRFLKNEPHHPGLRLAQARLAEMEKDWPSVEDYARRSISGNSQLGEAHSRLGRSLLKQDKQHAIAIWWQNVPDLALELPETWVTIGKFHLTLEEIEVAARCFWEAGKREAASLEANYLLGLQLVKLGRSEDAKLFLKQAELFEKYRKFLDFEFDSKTFLPQSDLKEQADQARLLGLTFEAYAWSSIALQSNPNSEWAAKCVAELRSIIGDCRQRVALDKNPFLKIDLSSYPLPSQSMQIANAKDTVERANSLSESVSFVDLANHSGLEFSYDNGVDHSISGAQRPYDFVGGGAAVIDFDKDGWPDLFLPQGCALEDWSGKPLNGETDQIFRNLSGIDFQRTTEHCLPRSVDYSAGGSAGDINSDGFADLFVANLGRNRLLSNNGDGTFSDTSSTIREDSSQWTTSCLICDLNQDGNPDLYSVNYLSGDVTSKVCRDSSGRKDSCAPQDFSAAQDQLHLSDGTGIFLDATQESGIKMPSGKGLGLVAADLNKDGRLDVFIANDGVPNFYFEGQGPSAPQLFTERASVSGLAVNGVGESEACMGVVIEDMNLDNSPELLVTNFLDETNTLYSYSSAPGLFEDVTPKTHLGPTSRNVLSFGVQAIDSNLDGLSDLVIANGHVDDFSDRGVPYQMKPQYFHNQGQLCFQQRRFDRDNAFFAQAALGRCVTRMDWNRDGAEDIVVTRLKTPVALLQNQTNPRGHFIGVKLVGTTCSRDALGATVSAITKSDHVITRYLSGGDGYLASNDRMLIFGLGEATGEIQIDVQWPHGDKQQFRQLQVDQFYTIVQGAQHALKL